MSEWYYSDKDERRGPISLEMLQRLIQNGAIGPDELAWTEGMTDWKAISSIPELRPQQQKSSSFGSPSSDRPRFDPDRDISRTRDQGHERDSYDDSRRYDDTRRSNFNKAPHRGTTILVLGLLGILVCGFIAFPAYTMGKADLEEMKAGRMDPSGEGLTRAGYILGIVGMVIIVLNILLFCGMFGLMGVVGR